MADLENNAIQNAGFELIDVNSNHFGVQFDFDKLGDRPVSFRCYANQERMIDAMMKHVDANQMTPDMHVANDWYKIVDRYDLKFFGRRIAYLNLKRFGYLETYKEMRSFETALRSMFDGHTRSGKSFVKSNTKSSFVAKERTYKT